jgi:hypothetical protein
MQKKEEINFHTPTLLFAGLSFCFFHKPYKSILFPDNLVYGNMFGCTRKKNHFLYFKIFFLWVSYNRFTVQTHLEVKTPPPLSHK